MYGLNNNNGAAPALPSQWTPCTNISCEDVCLDALTCLDPDDPTSCDHFCVWSLDNPTSFCNADDAP